MRTFVQRGRSARARRTSFLAALACAFLLSACTGHQFDVTPTAIPPTPTLPPTATAVPPTATPRPTPTMTPLIIPTPQRQATPAGNAAPVPAWQESGSLLSPRIAHTATLLADGSVLVVGGLGSDDSSPTVLATAERYNPQTGTWRPAGSLATARAHHTATPLPDGTVLVAGGDGPDGALATAEIYDPATDRWRATGVLLTPRSYHTATTLPDGDVLVLGGYTDPAAPPAESEEDYTLVVTAERYDRASGTWRPAGSLLTPRAGHTTTALLGEELLVVGGSLEEQLGETDALTAERFDPRSGQSRPAASLPVPHMEHTATLLSGGSVLVIGDLSREVFRYDPADDAWRSAGWLETSHRRLTATLLPSGMLMVLGGDEEIAPAELFAVRDGLTYPSAQPRSAWHGHTATTLVDGSVLIAGGYDFDQEHTVVTVRTARYRPAADRTVTTGQPGEQRINFATWPQVRTGETLRAVADPTGASYRVHMSAAVGSYGIEDPNRKRYADFTLSVTIDQLNSYDTAAGVFFRARDVPESEGFAYVVYLTPEGEFALLRIGDDKAWHSVQPPIASGAIRFDGANRLQIVCQGDTIQIIINGQSVGRYHAALTTEGQIGLFFAAFGDEPLDVSFSRLSITPLP